MLSIFKEFEQDELDLHKLNFVRLRLIPKENDATIMKNFRPIRLINCSYKIFTEVLTNRFGNICNRLITANQSAFIKGRYILESVVLAHEIAHATHRSGEEGIVLKLDYESV